MIVCLAISTLPIGIFGSIHGLGSKEILLISLILIITFFSSIAFSFIITRPIVKLTTNINDILKGKFNVSLESSEISEIKNLTDSLNKILVSLKLAITRVSVNRGDTFKEVVKVKKTVLEKYEDLIDNIDGWAWETDTIGIYTYCSSNISKFLGYSYIEIIGKSIFDFMTSEDAEKTKTVFNKKIKNKKPIKNLENWNIKNNGEKVCIITNGVPFYNHEGNLLGYRGVNIDITREKIAYERINSLNKELTDIKLEIKELLNEYESRKGLEIFSLGKKKLNEKWFENEVDSVFLIDENANILDCNKNMYKMLGYSKKEMLSFNMADFDVLESKNEIINKINQTKKNGVYSFKTIHKKKDGSAILVSENIQYLEDKNKFKCIVREDFSIN